MRHKILNCTPHAIHIVDGPTYPPSGTVARLATQRIAQPPLPDGTPRISLRIQREVIDLPPPEEGQWIIVSAMVREAIRYRDDLVSPGDLVRDAEGRVIGCESLITSDRLDMGDSVPEWRIDQAWDATPSEHAATLIGERKAGSRWGRPFERGDWHELLNRWLPFWPGAEIAAPWLGKT